MLEGEIGCVGSFLASALWLLVNHVWQKEMYGEGKAISPFV
jgi:hypothetical protein